MPVPDPKRMLECVGKMETGGSDMATSLKSLILAVIIFALSPRLVASETYQIRDAIRIVAITADEGIHYERGCSFYELRELLAENESDTAGAIELSKVPLFEFRLIGKSGNSTIYVGDHWMRTSAGTTVLPIKAYERIAALVALRKGAGVPKAKIDKSIRRATKLIRHPKYLEENKCAEQS